ncbi:MAG: hypothetical protein ACRD3C_00160, partial [Vicinamibacterales bacterium]
VGRHIIRPTVCERHHFVDRFNGQRRPGESDAANPRQPLLLARSANVTIHANRDGRIAFRATDTQDS